MSLLHIGCVSASLRGVQLRACIHAYTQSDWLSNIGAWITAGPRSAKNNLRSYSRSCFRVQVETLFWMSSIAQQLRFVAFAFRAMFTCLIFVCLIKYVPRCSNIDYRHCGLAFDISTMVRIDFNILLCVLQIIKSKCILFTLHALETFIFVPEL